jgi:uncharacterized Zn-finger protein
MSKQLSPSNTKLRYEVSPQSLPLSCPLPKNRLWDAHPRVYLPITKMDHVTCPYCGTEYFLKKEVT